MRIGLLTIAVGALQIMLDKGQEEDWFGSHFILALAITSVVGFVCLIVWELRTKAPIIDLRMFKNFNFSIACFMMFNLGLLLFAGLGEMMPQLLQTLMGVTPPQVGGSGAFRRQYRPSSRNAVCPGN